MSVVIEYYPEKASKESLRNYLISEGFYSCQYFLKPFPKGSLYYSWFDENEYKSRDGIEAVIYPCEESKSKNKWLLFTRSRAYASAYDKQKQNEVVRNARKLFGGYFLNDCAGKNKYITIDQSHFLLPQESGILQAFERVKSKIYELRGAIDEHNESPDFDIKDGTHKDIVNLIKNNPILSTVVHHIYNSPSKYIKNTPC